ncbi:hypothetical protein BN982_03229 [Halobacillus karajensis]|uniref:Uncharacterized protein n=1 Tax=Halobacillus karajensis TaxID=195088 RepID=A0A024P3F1_9BACI|nr:hypothetical protein BN982_01028 [Halobacillus karajensis]CDQ19336.1 hypothetical protein BN982_01625 [Halobacillus karajensis]CDQ20062.1 hypothetical protein BN982_02375 [Halobacillus karajensis]CDQ20874.1 hypothetical protein BN982_03229 [Halobacillus karajensis]CDQ22501.1 hypothetical protein BN983_00712 [Halobacillus karajensis]
MRIVDIHKCDYKLITTQNLKKLAIGCTLSGSENP